jgi:membrane protein implicated in regulation of membrane protease activity
MRAIFSKDCGPGLIPHSKAVCRWIDERFLFPGDLLVRKDRRILFRYALFQIPGLGVFLLILFLIGRWVALPAWIFWGSILIWVGKDILMFRFVRRAYERDRAEEIHSLIGCRGIAEERLDPSGYIRVRGELWQAKVVEGRGPIEKGEIVLIQEIDGLLLFVRQVRAQKHDYKAEEA